jgi:hypothetical protein
LELHHEREEWQEDKHEFETKVFFVSDFSRFFEGFFWGDKQTHNRV